MSRADLDKILAALNEAPKYCRFHDDNFGFLGYEWPGGPPRCDSCKQPWRVTRALEALSRLIAEASR